MKHLQKLKKNSPPEIFLTCVVILLVLLLPVRGFCADTVNVCDDIALWPPFIYYKIVDGKPDKTKITGATVDFLDAIFKEINMQHTLTLLPWKQCLRQVELFDRAGRYEVFVDGSYTAERAKSYYLSPPLYRTNIGVFYSKKKFPNTPPITQASDLNKYRLCGTFGYNFQPFIAAGLDAEINTTGKTNPTNFMLLTKQRYDFFLSAIQPIYGGHLTGLYVIPDEIASMPVPGVKKFTFYLFVSKTSPRALELSSKINQAVIKLHETGVSNAIFKKYLPGGTSLE